MRGIGSEWGGIDILVNNAGILRDRTIAKMTLQEWREVIDVNLSGVFHCCKWGLEILRDGGAIVSMGSLSAEAGFHGQSNYAAAKAGVQGLTRALSRECARRSIRVNAVAPGLIDTSMAASIPESVRAEMQKAIPWRRFGQVQEVADAVLVPLLAPGRLHHRAHAASRRRLARLSPVTPRPRRKPRGEPARGSMVTPRGPALVGWRERPRRKPPLLSRRGSF